MCWQIYGNPPYPGPYSFVSKASDPLNVLRERGNSFCEAAGERQLARRDVKHRRCRLPRLPEA